jgi:hypothetical protein
MELLINYPYNFIFPYSIFSKNPPQISSKYQIHGIKTAFPVSVITSLATRPNSGQWDRSGSCTCSFDVSEE